MFGWKQKPKRQRNMVEIESKQLARWAHRMEMVELQAKFLSLQMDVRDEINKAFEAKDDARVECLNRVNLLLSSAQRLIE